MFPKETFSSLARKPSFTGLFHICFSGNEGSFALDHQTYDVTTSLQYHVFIDL